MGLIHSIRRQRKIKAHSGFISAINDRQRSLQTKFDAFCELHDPSKLELAKELVAQEGTVDAEVEGYASTDNQRDLSIKFHWGHNHRFNDDFTVEGRMQNRHVHLMAHFLERNNLDDNFFNGKNVVDVGCWTGGTTLMLKMLGAQRVLALEEVQKYANCARSLVQDVYELPDIVCEGTGIYQLETEKNYDVIYFPGVIYHLSDPVLALRRLFNMCKPGGHIFVETAGIEDNEPIARYDGNRIYDRNSSPDNLNRGGWNWFIPSASCLERWMVEAGFDETDCYYSYASDRVFGYGRKVSEVEITRAGLSVPDID